MNQYIRNMLAVGLGAAAIVLCVPAQIAVAAPVEVTEGAVEAAAIAAPVLSAEATDYHSVTISWDAVDQAAVYELQQSEDKKNYTTAAVITPDQEMRYTVSDLHTTKIYYFRMVVTGVNGMTATSARLKVKPVLSSPTVTKLEASASDKIDIAWNAVDGADFYRVYRSATKTGGYKSVKTVFGTSYTNTVASNETYYYKIMPLRYNPDGKKVRGRCSTPQSVIALGELPVPTGIQAALDDKEGVKLKWSESKTASSYRIYRAQGADENYVQIAVNVTGTSYVDSGLVAGETYYYRVEAVRDTMISEKSDAVSIQIGSIKVNTRTLYLGPGVTATLFATSDLTGPITYSSKNEGVAVVTEDGTVIGVAPGKTTIQASVGGASASVTVTVTDSVLNGIDVSKWQQDIDWKTVKDSGIKFAMLRLAHGPSKDIQFENYYAGAAEQGIPVGIYCYTLAKSVDEGIEEAQYLLELLDGRPLTYPIALDLESDNQIKNMNKAARTQLILEYKDIIESAGYQFVVYANLNWLKNYIDQSKLEEENVDIWIARYRSQSLGHGYEGGGNVRLWQYSSTGQVDGILDAYGRYINVDLDVCYEGY